MATKSKRHTHKYYRVEMGSSLVWACALSDCNHYMPTHMAKMVNGKGSICWQCGELMTLDPINMRMDRPTCNECRLGEVDSGLPLSNRMKEFISKEN